MQSRTDLIVIPAPASLGADKKNVSEKILQPAINTTNYQVVAILIVKCSCLVVPPQTRYRLYIIPGSILVKNGANHRKHSEKYNDGEWSSAQFFFSFLSVFVSSPFFVGVPGAYYVLVYFY